MWIQKTLAVLCVASLTSNALWHSSAQADCVKQYEELEAKKAEAVKKSAKLAGTGVVLIVLSGLTVRHWAMGVVAVVVIGGVLYFAYEADKEGKMLTKQIDVLSLYQQSKKWTEEKLTNSNAEMSPELAAFSGTLPEDIRSEVPKLIVSLMETGAFCAKEKLVSALELQEVLKKFQDEKVVSFN